MALGDYPGSPARAFIRSDSGLQGTDTNPCTGWVDATGTADATLSEALVPTYIADPGDGAGPVARHASSNGFVLGGFVGGTEWTWTGVFSTGASFASFENVLSDETGGGFAIYLASGTWTITENNAGTTETFGSASTSTEYEVTVVRTAASYRVWIDGSLAITTSTVVPSTTPTLVTCSFAGSGAPWTGDWKVAGVVWASDQSASIATISAANAIEANGASADNIAGASAGVAAASATVTGIGAIAGASAGTSSASADVSASASVSGSAAGVATASGTISGIGAIAGSSAGVATAAAAVTDGSSYPFTDDFSGSGALLGYTTVNAASLTDVTRTSDRYRAAVTGSTDNDTAHYNALYGRFDGKLLSFTTGFDYIFSNCRLGTTSDPATPPTLTTEYMFVGVQANNDLLGTPTDGYQQLTGGHRGPNITTEGGWTVEGKTTISATSSVNDAGADAIISTKAIDIRIVGTSGPNAIAWYWRLTGDTTWIPYSMPGTAPTWSDDIYVGPITYAFSHFGPDFAGYIDGIELPPGAVAGASAGVATASATVTGTGAIVGASAGVAAASATVTALGAVAGASTGTSSAAATVTGSGVVAGASAGTSAASATVAGLGAVAGASAGVASASATVGGTGAVAGTSDGTSAATAAVTGLGSEAVIGAAAGVATASATVTGVGAIAGASTGTSTATATVVSNGPIAGSAAGVASASATVFGFGAITCASAGAASATAAIFGIGAVAGSSAGVASASAYVANYNQYAITGTATGLSTATATLFGVGSIAGSVAGVASASASITDASAVGITPAVSFVCPLVRGPTFTTTLAT